LTTSNLVLAARQLPPLLLQELQVSCQPHRAPRLLQRARERVKRSEGRICAYYEHSLFNSNVWWKWVGKGRRTEFLASLDGVLERVWGGIVDLGRTDREKPWIAHVLLIDRECCKKKAIYLLISGCQALMRNESTRFENVIWTTTSNTFMKALYSFCAPLPPTCCI